MSSRDVVASTTSTRPFFFKVRAFSRATTLWSMPLVSTTDRANAFSASVVVRPSALCNAASRTASWTVLELGGFEDAVEHDAELGGIGQAEIDVGDFVFEFGRELEAAA